MTTTKPLDIIAGAPNKPLTIGDIEIPCYVLEDETRVVTQSGMFRSLGLSRRGPVRAQNGVQMPRFAASRAIYPFMTDDLKTGISSPILFRASSTVAYGYPATILVLQRQLV